MKPPYKNAHTSREAELLTALKALEPYLDAIACYASTMDEHEPNRLIKQARAAIARVEHTNMVDDKHAPITPDAEIRRLNEALEAHKIMLSESSLREGRLLNALHEIADLDKHGGYNTACERARRATGCQSR